MASNVFKQWLRVLRRWWKRLHHNKPKHPRILKRWYTKHGAILQLERETRGARATLRAVRSTGQQYLLTLDYLREIQGDYIGEFGSTPIYLRARVSPVRAQTHRFGVFKILASGNSRCLGAWDVDLEGYATGIRSQTAPGRALLQTAQDYLKYGEQIDWLGTLEEKARVELGSPYHNLAAISLKPLK